MEANIRLIPFMGMYVDIPELEDQDQFSRKITIRSNGWFRRSNWSWDLEGCMSYEISSQYYSVGYCVSGIGKFNFRKGILIDCETNELLFVRVKNMYNENSFWLVSDKFDTPKCPRKYKNMRVHWRKYMMKMIDYDIKICKINHQSLQKFKANFNYSPTKDEILDLKFKCINVFSEKPVVISKGEIAYAR
jgi:hypothetical protein